MKTTKILAVAMLAAASLFMTSCNKDGDTIKPLIDLHEPEDGEEFPRGGTMCIEMDLSDDTALESFKINVHNAFDGHDHTKTRHGGDDYNTDTANAFKYNKTSEELQAASDQVIDVKGLKNAHRHIHVAIPADAAYGDYHLMVYCYDAECNESYVARSISITEDAEDHHHHE